MKNILLVVLCLFPALVLAQVPPSTHHKNHNDYSTWQRPDGLGSCCNHTDCDIVKELSMDEQGQRRVLWRGEVYSVPEEVYLKNKVSPDGNAHACIIGYKVVCFVPGNIMGDNSSAIERDLDSVDVLGLNPSYPTNL